MRVIARIDTAVMGRDYFFASDLQVKMIALKNALNQFEFRGPVK